MAENLSTLLDRAHKLDRGLRFLTHDLNGQVQIYIAVNGHTPHAEFLIAILDNLDRLQQDAADIANAVVETSSNELRASERAVGEFLHAVLQAADEGRLTMKEDPHDG